MCSCTPLGTVALRKTLLSSPLAITATPQCPDPGQASHTYCVFFYQHKSLLIPSKPFLVSIKAQLPPCFSWQGLVQPHGAGTVTGPRQSRTACAQASPHVPCPDSTANPNLPRTRSGAATEAALSRCYQLFSHPLLVFHPIPVATPLCPVTPCPCPRFHLQHLSEGIPHFRSASATGVLILSRRPTTVP